MKLRNAILSGLMFGMAHGMAAYAEPTKGYYSMDAMGCMLLKECTKDVEKITSSDDLRAAFPDSDWGPVADEFDQIMGAFKQIGVDVHLADEKYFPVGGDFIFPEHHIRVRPEPGMLVCFPSSHHYMHGVEPVTRGKRYSIVCWATVKGVPSLEDINLQLSQQYGVPVV